MKSLTKIILPIFLISGAMAQDIPYMDGQSNQLEKGKRLLENGSYSSALQTLERGLKKADGDTISYYAALAKVNKNLHNYGMAEEYYRKVYKYEATNADLKIEYAEVLAQNGNVQEASQVLSDIQTADEVIVNRKEGFEKARALMENKGSYEVSPLDINTGAGDFFAANIDGALYVSSNRKSGLFGWINEKDGAGFWNLYKISEEGNERVKSLSNKYHQGPFCYVPATGELFLTENQPISRRNKDADQESKLKISVYKKNQAGEWELFGDLPVNDRNHNVAHPFYDESTGRLYFASDMEGGKGNSDIYYVERAGEGWSDPHPLDYLNTTADEMYPAVSDETIYFASNGYEGLGGLDIYKARVGDGSVVNLGAPINSFKDDFGWYFREEGSGYFASNRDGGEGGDDLYSWHSNLGDVEVVVLNDIDLSMEAIKITPVNKASYFEKYVSGSELQLTGVKGDQYQLVINQPDYERYENTVEIADGARVEINLKAVSRVESSKAHLVSYLKLGNVSNEKYFQLSDGELTEITKLPDSAEVAFKVGNIYFPFDSSNPDDPEEVVAVISGLMNSHQHIYLEIIGYADSRGSKPYNENLSLRRTESIQKLLLENGISESRISLTPVGESTIYNECTDGVKCSEKEHAINRRVEFSLK